MSTPAFLTLLRSLGLALTGRIRFPRTLVGRTVTRMDGRRFTIFRQAVTAPGPAPADETATVLCFRFRFAAGTPALNKRLSLIPIPLIVGYPGFRTKIWALDHETGGFIGLYEWDSVEDAQSYVRSLAITLMKKRAAPGTVEQDIIDGTTVAAQLARFGLALPPAPDVQAADPAMPRSGASRAGP